MITYNNTSEQRKFLEKYLKEQEEYKRKLEQYKKDKKAGKNPDPSFIINHTVI